MSVTRCQEFHTPSVVHGVDNVRYFLVGNESTESTEEAGAA